MPQIVMGPRKFAPKVDGSVRSKAYAFLEKLAENDTTPGLHIEPILHAKDPRVRTGRVDDYWRAVLFKLQGEGQETIYVHLGVWQHDDSIKFARRAQLEVNPVNGVLGLSIEPDTDEPTKLEQAPPAPHVETNPVLVDRGITVETLVNEIGLDQATAELAVEAATDDDIAALCEMLAPWEGVALIDLAAGRSVVDVKTSLELTNAVDATTDGDLIEALRRPASRMEFAFIEDNEELRRAIEDDDFDAWRVFLHPEQRRWAEGSWGGSYRLSGGAGTGKTVVLLHRARMLARRRPSARILLTTYNTTLADALLRDLKTLDPSVPIAAKLGDPGVFVRGVDSAVRTVLNSQRAHVPAAVAAVLGERTGEVGHITDRNAWRVAIASDGDKLPEKLRSPAFFEAEYAMVILPAKATSFETYARLRRPGRGTALDRSGRAAVWAVVAAYRLNAGIRGSVDFGEAAAVAAAALDLAGDRPFDHVLVDEGQDLEPAKWQFLRALVAEGRDDLFIAEDSHQRIYGHRVVLGRYGVKIVGRSQRLRLNYRTTAQNLRFAVSVLAGTDFVDLEDEPEDAKDYRSARLGPVPQRIGAASIKEEYVQSASLLNQWLGSAVPETIGILVRSEQAGEQFARAMEEHGLTVRVVGSDKAVPTGAPVVMTMHRAKGMEFSRVLIFGADASAVPASYQLRGLTDADRDDALKREKSLLYVAASRARDELAIIWAGEPSALLPQDKVVSVSEDEPWGDELFKSDHELF